MKKRIGHLLIVLGIVVLLLSATLVGYNVWDNARAKHQSHAILAQLVFPDPPTQSIDSQLLAQLPMPTVAVDGNHYIGKIEIPKLAVSLPVMDTWNNRNLKTAPCRYAGSVYQNNLVIAAHNYNCHFGQITSLVPNDIIMFTDMDGNRRIYTVVQLKVLPPTAVKEMTDGTYDLTLFTCTYSGSERITVCCKQVKS